MRNIIRIMNRTVILVRHTGACKSLKKPETLNPKEQYALNPKPTQEQACSDETVLGRFVFMQCGFEAEISYMKPCTEPI